MNKKYLIGGSLIIVILLAVVGFVVVKHTQTDGKITLNKIVKKFNTSDTIKTYKEYGYEIKASKRGSKLVISSNMSGSKTYVNYQLDGTILSNDELSGSDLMTAVILIDSIGQLQGYKDGELSENLNAFPEKTNQYTVQNEGFELKENGEFYSLKIDLAKKIPLLDLSDLYLKPDTFDMIKEIVEENSAGNQTGRIAKLAYNVEVAEENNYIYLGERDKLTDSAYKSILSALEVMYGTATVDKFKTIYPEFQKGKITVDGFTIETDYKMDNPDESVFKDMKVVLVTIDNNAIKK